MIKIRPLWTLAAAACCLFCANLAILLVVGSYDFHLGPLHFVAHELFKPFQLVAATFWIAVFLRGFLPEPSAPTPFLSWLTPLTTLAIALALYAAVYLPSASLNFSDPGWTLSDVSMRIHSIPEALQLFTSPQPDGFYRPLTFVSLWADYGVFGSALWAYHLQSIVLHAINSVLVFYVAREFNFEHTSAFWAAAWFAFAAMNFEPILWPAARFDLFATAFVLVSIIWFLRYLRDPGPAGVKLLVSAAAYALALMNKEIAYCVPLLLAVIVLTSPHRAASALQAVGTSGEFLRKTVWQIDSLDRSKLLRAALVFAGITAVMLAVRIAIYHGLGGYPPAINGGVSPHFSFTFKSITGLITRVIPIPLFGINTSVALSSAMARFVVLYAVVIAWVVVQGASLGKPERVLIVFAILSALPALNLTGWVGESMRHSRYLYFPGLWIIMAAAVLISRRPLGNFALTLLVAANLAGAVHNLGVYRTTIENAHAISRQIAADTARYHAGVVDLASVDEAPSGVYFFRWEIVRALRAEQPGVCISLVPASCPSDQAALRYEWLPASNTVRLQF